MKDHNYLTQKSIIKRGWSKRLIDKYLITPDKEKTNAHYRSGPKMKLYLLSRVEEVESLEEFKEEYIKVQKRKQSGKKASETHKNKLEQYLLEWLDNIETNIKIPSMYVEQLLKKAMLHYNRLHYEKIIINEKDRISFDINDVLINNFIDIECEDGDILFLRRISTNYLRHAFNDYETLLEETNIKYWKQEAYLKMKNCILERIVEKYPYLKNSIQNIIEKDIIENSAS